MILLILDNVQKNKLIIIILSVVTMVLCIFFIDNRRQTVKLQKELAKINRELHLKQITHDKRVKEFEQEARRHHQQVMQMKSEILSKLKRENENRY
jgi:cell division protein FtsL